VLLALVFGLGFVFLGIGSGSNGITDALQNAFNFGSGGGGSSISSLEKKTEKNPLKAQAWRDLATAYETKQRTDDAIRALSQYVGLKPKDTAALAELANEYATQAQNAATQYQSSQQSVSAISLPGDVFGPAATSQLGKAYSSTSLKDPIAAAVQTQSSTQQSTAYSNYQTAQKNAEQTYVKLVKVTPNDAKKPIEEDVKVATVQTQASQESVAAEATAAPSLENIPQGERSVAPAIGIGESARRVRATWQRELIAHFDKHKRYPAERALKSAEILVSFALDRMGHVLSMSVVKGSGDPAFDQAALAMIKRSDPVPQPPPLIADEGLNFTLPVIFRVKGKS